ncbi:conserved hypothetical protein [Ricinus communis]|uniref:FBD domain-containing protein n=1 Tax=Ricinus communis TaxID=3988 RepID=B9RWF9_RICCO|nr:conserved hypothetical protein [Ricinus communis]
MSCTEEMLNYVADKCPNSTYFSLPNCVFLDEAGVILELIEKLKELQLFGIAPSPCLIEVTAKISSDCKHFEGLSTPSGYIGDEEASAIVTNLPRIRSLTLTKSYIERVQRFVIDREILKMASHIKIFNYKGLSLEDEEQ